MAGIGEACLEGTVVREQEEPLAVEIQAPGRAKSGKPEKVGKARPRGGVAGEAREDREGLIE
jgi:hypothetical protein